MSLDDDARAELAALEAAGRLRVPRIVSGRQGTTITLDASGSRDTTVLVRKLPEVAVITGALPLAHDAASQ